MPALRPGGTMRIISGRLAHPILLTFPVVLGLAGGGVTHGRELTFSERVAAQEAIERVYYAHQIGATRPFEDVVTREVLERKVGTYLMHSAALERFWATQVTAVVLQAEM